MGRQLVLPGSAGASSSPGGPSPPRGVRAAGGDHIQGFLMDRGVASWACNHYQMEGVLCQCAHAFLCQVRKTHSFFLKKIFPEYALGRKHLLATLYWRSGSAFKAAVLVKNTALAFLGYKFSPAKYVRSSLAFGGHGTSVCGYWLLWTSCVETPEAPWTSEETWGF